MRLNYANQTERADAHRVASVPRQTHDQPILISTRLHGDVAVPRGRGVAQERLVRCVALRRRWRCQHGWWRRLRKSVLVHRNYVAAWLGVFPEPVWRTGSERSLLRYAWRRHITRSSTAASTCLGIRRRGWDGGCLRRAGHRLALCDRAGGRPLDRRKRVVRGVGRVGETQSRATAGWIGGRRRRRCCTDRLGGVYLRGGCIRAGHGAPIQLYRSRHISAVLMVLMTFWRAGLGRAPRPGRRVLCGVHVLGRRRVTLDRQLSAAMCW